VSEGRPLQEQHHPKPSPTTLARLQHAQAPLNPQQQTTNHPRSQRLRTGHLEATQRLTDQDRELVKRFINGLLLSHEAKRLAA
jgi:hypothetical protein